MTSTEILWLVYVWLPTCFFIDLTIHSVLVAWQRRTKRVRSRNLDRKGGAL